MRNVVYSYFAVGLLFVMAGSALSISGLGAGALWMTWVLAASGLYEEAAAALIIGVVLLCVGTILTIEMAECMGETE